MKTNWSVSNQEAFIRLQNNGWWCLVAEVVIILYYVNKTQEITSLRCISKVIEYWLVLAKDYVDGFGSLQNMNILAEFNI